VGKTRLCQSIMDEARARGALCLVGRCSEMQGVAADNGVRLKEFVGVSRAMAAR
jgi:hypothetical protein